LYRLSQPLQSRPIETCAHCGIWAATAEAIQQEGCVLPADLKIPDDFKILSELVKPIDIAASSLFELVV